MKASRLLSILMLLQARGRMTANALAQTMEVSPRTILRDIDQLSAAGVPLWGERGRQGGFQLRAGWSTELTGMTEPEAAALLLAGLPGPATELGLGARLRRRDSRCLRVFQASGARRPTESANACTSTRWTGTGPVTRQDSCAR